MSMNSKILEFKHVPFPLGTTLESAQRKASFFGERGYGIVTNAKGFGLRVKAEVFEEAVEQINPGSIEKFKGEKYEVSGLPVGMGEQSLVLFLDGWKMSPIHTFRQGNRRTWIVRAEAAPFTDKIQHENGLAIIKRAEQRVAPSTAKERWQPSKLNSNAARSKTFPQCAPKSWAQVVSAAQKPVAGTPATEAAASGRKEPPRKPCKLCRRASQRRSQPCWHPSSNNWTSSMQTYRIRRATCWWTKSKGRRGQRVHRIQDLLCDCE